ncbi:MAG: hypothetical protein PHQ72_13500 [Hespellia sp.]|nr:hypothetical protein [Hespellia sp.]
MDENNNIPAAGEQVLFEQVPPNAEAQNPQNEIPTAEPEIPAAEPEIPAAEPEIPTAGPEIPTAESKIPTAEAPQQQYQYQYQQTPPPNNYQYQNASQNNQQYNAIPPNTFVAEPDTTPMKLGDWLVTLLLLMIPCVNIIMMFVWAFGDKTGNLNRKNYAKAMLILLGILLVIYLFVIIIMAIAIGASFSY